MSKDPYDPYKGNLLVQGLGPILNDEALLRRLTCRPQRPPARIVEIPRHIRRHMVMNLRDLHIPSAEGLRLAQTVDLLVRQSYRYRDPTTPTPWSDICGEPGMQRQIAPRAPPTSAVEKGISGVGKTEAALRAFACYPSQVIEHERFPKLVGHHHQIVYLSADVPSSGRCADLAANLMLTWDSVFAQRLPDLKPRFADTLRAKRHDGSRMLDEWRQVALSHFLGVLHLDEVQNFFKIPTLEERRKKATGGGDDRELRIIEDQALKWILTLTNTWQIGLLVSGTPDGVEALERRFSNVQRLAGVGYHRFDPFHGWDDENFKMLVTELLHYQYVSNPLTISPELLKLIFDRTAGVQRLVIALWVGAHRVAFERKSSDDLRLDDFQKAAQTQLAPVADAVAALGTGDVERMRRYQDLIPGDDAFWNQFWGDAR